MGAYDPKREETFHIKGDKPLVAQGQFGAGYASTLNLDKSKREVDVRYKDFIMTVDLYEVPSVSGQKHYRVVLLCPRCTNALTIESGKKQIDYDAERNALSIEPFQCTWELDPSKEGRRMEFGFGLCNLRIGIDRNVARDA